LERAAVILAGGSSSRFGREKALVRLAGKPLICYVFEKVADIVDEVIVVASSEGQKKRLTPLSREPRQIRYRRLRLTQPSSRGVQRL